MLALSVVVCILVVGAVESAFTPPLDPIDATVWNVSGDLPWLPSELPNRKILKSWFPENNGGRDVCIDQSGMSNNFTGYEYVRDIYTACEAAGEVCNTNMCGVPGPFFRSVEKSWSCPKLWKATELDQPSRDHHPPAWDTLPDGVRDRFHYGTELIHVHGPKKVYDNKYYGHEALKTRWSQAYVDEQIQVARDTGVHGQYGVWHAKQLREIIKKYSPMAYEKKLRALVVGSETPWVEATLLSVGFAHVTTLEYGTIVTDHPQLSTFTPDQFRAKVLAGEYSGDKGFDVVAIYSSTEHSGLGRYGDAINPPGDLVMLARVHCVTKEGGTLYFAGPMAGDKDRIHFNGHRIYGPVMLPQLMANWKQVAGPQEIVPTSFVHIVQPVLVMQK